MINLQKLKKVVQKDGKIEAQCPACAAAGADSRGNHLVIYPSGAFSCVANPDDTEHNRTIMKLAGERGAPAPPQLVIRREKIPEITTLLTIGRIGQQKRTPAAKPATSLDQAATGCVHTRPECPTQVAPPDAEAPTITDEAVCNFLYGT